MTPPRRRGPRRALRIRSALARLRGAVPRSVELYHLISLALVLAAPVVTFAASRVKGWWIYVVLVGQLALAAATWIKGEVRAKSIEKLRQEASVETLVAVGDGLEPLTLSLAKYATFAKPRRVKERSGMIQAVLAAAIGLGPESSRTRACYFTLEAEPGQPRRLVHGPSIGRSATPTPAFIEGTKAGDAVLLMVDTSASRYCDDVEENPPPGWESSERGEYKCFVSVAVSAGPRRFGMLTLDAVEPGALTREDRAMLQVLGHMLGIVEVLSS